jgi:hypothetical protein
MCLPAGLSSCPQGQDDLGVVAEARSDIYQHRGLALGEHRGLALGESRPQPPEL